MMILHHINTLKKYIEILKNIMYMTQRRYLYKIEIQQNLYLLVFHVKLNIGVGPSISLYINDFEFLKFWERCRGLSYL